MPPKSLKNAAAHAKKLGIVQPIGSFFKVQKKAGRPKKASTLTSIFDAADMRDKTAGAPPAAAAPAAAAPAAAAPVAAAPAAAAPAAAPAAKKSRRNYSEGENKRKLDEAIAEFKTGPIDPFTEKKVSLNVFAARMKIPSSVLCKHMKAQAKQKVHEPPRSLAAGVDAAAKAQRRRSSGQGNLSAVSMPTQRFVVDVIVRMDRANDGMTCPEIYEMIESLCPHLSREQCKRAFTQSIRPRFKAELSGIVIAQKSTTKRSAITISQQFRWHKVRSSIFLT